MLSDLRLEGNELILYALIYGFSQEGIREFSGSLAYMKDWLGTKRNQTVLDALRHLLDKGYLVKRCEGTAKRKRCFYSVAYGAEGVPSPPQTASSNDTESVSPTVQKTYRNGTESVSPRYGKRTAHGTKSGHNTDRELLLEPIEKNTRDRDSDPAAAQGVSGETFSHEEASVEPKASQTFEPKATSHADRGDKGMKLLLSSYERNIGVFPPPAREALSEWRNEFPDEVITRAIESASLCGVRNWAYINGILKAWRTDGVRTVGDVQAREERRIRRKPPDRAQPVYRTPEEDYNDIFRGVL